MKDKLSQNQLRNAVDTARYHFEYLSYSSGTADLSFNSYDNQLLPL